MESNSASNNPANGAVRIPYGTTSINSCGHTTLFPLLWSRR